MILYNVMIKIEYGVYNDWLVWMKVVYLLEMMKIGYFLEYIIFCLMGIDEMDGFIYSIQYLMNDFSVYQDYQKNEVVVMQLKYYGCYKDKYVVFWMIMKVIEKGDQL